MACELDSYGVPMDRRAATMTDLIAAIGAWGADKGITLHSSPVAQLAKLVEEIGELAGAVARNRPDDIEDGIGDAVVVLVMLAHLSETSLRDCVFNAWQEIRDRKGRMNAEGVFVKEADDAAE